MKTDRRGRPYLISKNSGTEVLVSTSTDTTWDEYGPTILLAIRNDLNEPIFYAGALAGYPSDRMHKSLHKNDHLVPAAGGPGGLGDTVRHVARLKNQNQQELIALASAASGLSPSARGVSLGPIMQTLADVQINQSSEEILRTTEEADLIGLNSKTLLPNPSTEGVNLTSSSGIGMPGGGVMFTSGGIEIPAGGILKGALVITGIHSREPIEVDVELYKESSLNRDQEVLPYEKAIRYHFQFTPD